MIPEYYQNTFKILPEYFENNPKNREKNAGKPFGKSMKIQWKINENLGKIELGAVLCPLAASWGALLASLSVLGASWERLESVLERLGGVPVATRSPKGTPHGPQEGPQIV